MRPASPSYPPGAHIQELEDGGTLAGQHDERTPDPSQRAAERVLVADRLERIEDELRGQGDKLSELARLTGELVDQGKRREAREDVAHKAEQRRLDERHQAELKRIELSGEAATKAATLELEERKAWSAWAREHGAKLAAALGLVALGGGGSSIVAWLKSWLGGSSQP
jgi:hypothetical protein